MRVLVLHEHGNEITEFIAPIDILKRAGIEVYVTHKTSLDNPLYNEGIVDKDVFEVSGTLNQYDAIIIPGGKRGVKAFSENWLHPDSAVCQDIKKYYQSGKLVAAICAAPSLLGNNGLLKGKKYTCYPGWESETFGGTYTGEEVVKDGNLITGRSMYYSTDFGLAIVEYLLGKEKRIEIEKKVKGLK